MVDKIYYNEIIKEDTLGIIEEDILKCSKNIIDLIEVGDEIVVYLRPDEATTRYVIESDSQLELVKQFVNPSVLKSIVTKERFKSVEYEG